MRRRHQPDDDLITTEEAQKVISLFAQKEKARLAEEARLAAMPKLADVAEMLGMSIEQARSLAAETVWPDTANERLQIELDANGEERICQPAVELLMQHAAQIELMHQRDAEERSKLSGIDDVAAEMRIPAEEARDLLKEVRSRNFWAKKLYRPKAAASKQTRAETYILVALILLVAIGASSAVWFIIRSAAPVPTPTYATALPAPGSTGTYVAPWASPNNWIVWPSGFDIPYGYSVTYSLSPGSAHFSSLASRSRSGPEMEMKQFLATFRPRSTPGRAAVLPEPVPGCNVPLSPTSDLNLSSDISGWIVATVTSPEGTRSVYLPDQIGWNKWDTSAGLEYRLNYASGLPANKLDDYRFPKVQFISLGNLSPAGLRLTVCGRGQVFQSAPAKSTRSIDTIDLKKAARIFLKEVYRRSKQTKGWKYPPAAISEKRLAADNYVLQIHNTYGTRPYSCTRLFRAMDSGDRQSLEEAWADLDKQLADSLDAMANQQP